MNMYSITLLKIDNFQRVLASKVIQSHKKLTLYLKCLDEHYILWRTQKELSLEEEQPVIIKKSKLSTSNLSYKITEKNTFLMCSN